jgi:hypothetical protein
MLTAKSFGSYEGWLAGGFTGLRIERDNSFFRRQPAIACKYNRESGDGAPELHPSVQAADFPDAIDTTRRIRQRP